MGKNILILYNYANHHELVSIFAKLLAKKGLNIDAFCMADFHFSRFTSIKWPWRIWIADFLTNKLKLPKMRGFFRSFFQENFVWSLISFYDFVMFESFPTNAYQYADYCIANKKAYGITFWGSDFLRIDEATKKRLKYYLDTCQYIRTSGRLKEELVNYYCTHFAENYEAKCLFAPFGNKNTSLLDNISERAMRCFFKQYAINSKKIIVTIGYNGHPLQHQDRIVDMLSKLPNTVKEKLYLIIPMTYSATKEQIEAVKRNFLRCGIPGQIMTDFMSNEDVAILRQISSIVINVQDTDGFAGSIREHLYCRNILLLGEWLNYPQLEKNNVFYIKINYDIFLNKLSDVIQNLEKYQNLCKDNHEKMKEYMSWDNCIDTLYNYFDKM